jgi:hypothetical protein
LALGAIALFNGCFASIASKIEEDAFAHEYCYGYSNNGSALFLGGVWNQA